MKREVLRQGVVQIKWASAASAQPVITGLRPLHLDPKRDALLYVPPTYTGVQQAPLAVMLHGAGGDAQHGMSLLKPVADPLGLILLAPYARGGTWDVIEKEHFDADVLFITQALQQVINQYNINPNQLAIGGFSDGASYALSLGLINGALFTHILAFSPGFFYAPQPSGQPRVYISHGVHDTILPINYCSRRLVPRLQKQQYNVLYREFDGEHVLPDAIRQEAVQWFLSSGY
jgi:predicted esterase